MTLTSPTPLTFILQMGSSFSVEGSKGPFTTVPAFVNSLAVGFSVALEKGRPDVVPPASIHALHLRQASLPRGFEVHTTTGPEKKVRSEKNIAETGLYSYVR